MRSHRSSLPRSERTSTHRIRWRQNETCRRSAPPGTCLSVTTCPHSTLVEIFHRTPCLFPLVLPFVRTRGSCNSTFFRDAFDRLTDNPRLQRTTRPTTRAVGAIHALTLWRSTTDTRGPKHDKLQRLLSPPHLPPVLIVFSPIAPPFRPVQRRSIDINCNYRVDGQGYGTRVSPCPRPSSPLSSAPLEHASRCHSAAVPPNPYAFTCCIPSRTVPLDPICRSIQSGDVGGEPPENVDAASPHGDARSLGTSIRPSIGATLYTRLC